ncbi:MAG: type II toxin-antitoxin system VapC family toxin [Gammaproteobacteria bacterium]|nr:type II toxin-antitoxin system VapC family toxin [Gammaproteobacteria bacterium]
MSETRLQDTFPTACCEQYIYERKLFTKPQLARGRYLTGHCCTVTAPLAWLIDTNVISEMMRPRPDPRGAAFLDSIADEGIGLASISVWEALDGISRLEPGRQRFGLADRFQGLVDELFEDRIIKWPLADAKACVQAMEVKHRHGESLDDHIPGAFLAASAVTRGLAIVTRNTSEFRNIGVETVDPSSTKS